ncbi:MAG TPA: hypothetical protein VK549_08495, partial [Acidimicrobiia bacterium]|nr:hypothetical protein [Acidimicrobiia bacterium]
ITLASGMYKANSEDGEGGGDKNKVFKVECAPVTTTTTPVTTPETKPPVTTPETKPPVTAPKVVPQAPAAPSGPSAVVVVPRLTG